MDFAITIKDDFVEVTAPEGQSGRMPLEAFFELGRPLGADTGDAPLPTGVRFVRTRGRVTIWVHETPPQVWNLKWIETGSGGSGSRTRPTYRDVIVSLPYIVVVAVFAPGDDDRINLTTRNECFFRNASLGSGEEDELLVPALLNCSLFDDPKGKTKIGFNEMPVVWICTQHLDRARFAGIGDDGRRLVAGFETLMTMLMGAGFNHSSDEHEYCSGFTANRQVDPRVATIEAWEQATREDPYFAVTVPWLSTGYTWQEVAERIFKHCGAARPGVRRDADVARAVFKYAAQRDRAGRRTS